MPPLDETEITAKLAALPAWQREDQTLVCTFVWKDFPAALAFVNQVGRLAEDAGHHPDIDIRWNRVRLCLTTHDAGGLTEKDFQLAASIEKLAQTL